MPFFKGFSYSIHQAVQIFFIVSQSTAADVQAFLLSKSVPGGNLGSAFPLSVHLAIFHR